MTGDHSDRQPIVPTNRWRMFIDAIHEYERDTSVLIVDYLVIPLYKAKTITHLRNLSKRS